MKVKKVKDVSVTMLSPDDLQQEGYVVNKHDLTEDLLASLANKMESEYVESLFWNSLKDNAEVLGLLTYADALNNIQSFIHILMMNGSLDFFKAKQKNWDALDRFVTMIGVDDERYKIPEIMQMFKLLKIVVLRGLYPKDRTSESFVALLIDLEQYLIKIR